MSGFICNTRRVADEVTDWVATLPRDLQDVYNWCCGGSAERGMEYCTCWEPVYDVEQTDPRLDVTGRWAQVADVPARVEMCDGCAYRGDSPERTGDESYSQPSMATPFYCHEGMRLVAKWRHTGSGVTVTAAPDQYAPPMLQLNEFERLPFRADGTPAPLCRGWAGLKSVHEDRKQTARNSRRSGG